MLNGTDRQLVTLLNDLIECKFRTTLGLLENGGLVLHTPLDDRGFILRKDIGPFLTIGFNVFNGHCTNNVTSVTNYRKDCHDIDVFVGVGIGSDTAVEDFHGIFWKHDNGKEGTRTGGEEGDPIVKFRVEGLDGDGLKRRVTSEEIHVGLVSILNRGSLNPRGKRNYDTVSMS